MNSIRGGSGCFGIVVSGGPAPGINGVISSSVIEAQNRGCEVIGIQDGFRGLVSREDENFAPLTTAMVSRIYNTGGSIIGTARYNPFRQTGDEELLRQNLEKRGIDKLIVIGGEGSAYLSYLMSKRIPSLRVVHVPKTIDNDLILPNKEPSFGFATARNVGTDILDTLMVDAKTCKRWFLVTSMGRRAGFLALGLGIASGATLTLIPEEFENGEYTPEDIAEVILGSIKKRAAAGKLYGMVIMAEGILDRLKPDSSPELTKCPRDELGRIRYAEITLGDVIFPPLKRMVEEAKIPVRLNTKNLGYELRCHKPVSFDIEYTRFLGWGAVKLLLDGHRGVMVTRDFDRIGYEPLENMVVGERGMISRKVDLSSTLYQVARSFMIR